MHKAEKAFRSAARHGKDVGKKNVPGKTGFATVEAKAKASGARNPKAVAGAVFQKMARERGR